jgi:hypothetical protein
MHRFGGEVMRDVEEARARVAALINADPSEIVFTSCGTESNNMAIYGAAEILGPAATIITSRVEHPAVLGPCRHFHDDHGYRVVEIGVDGGGLLDLDAAPRAARRPGPVSLMWANNETGVLFPMEEIARIVKAAGAVLHTDAVQAVGKVPIDVRRSAGGSALLRRPQAARAQGHRRALHPPRHAPEDLHARRPPGARTPRRHRERALHRRPGPRLRPGARTSAGEHPIAALRDRLEERLLASCPDAASTATARTACRTPPTSASR